MRLIYILSDVASWIEENKSKQINIYSTATKSGFSLWYLQRLFKIHSGMALAKYIRLRKMSAAAIALRLSKKNIQELSRDLGYQSQASFSTTFSRCYGISPRKFRDESYWSFEKMIHRYDYIPLIKKIKFKIKFDHEYIPIAKDMNILKLSEILDFQQEYRIKINVAKKNNTFTTNENIEQSFFLCGKERKRNKPLKFLSVQVNEPLYRLKDIQSLLYAGLLPALSITRRPGCDIIIIDKDKLDNVMISSYMIPIKNLKSLNVNYTDYN